MTMTLPSATADRPNVCSAKVLTAVAKLCKGPPRACSSRNGSGTMKARNAIAGAWPGATVDAAIHDDPIGATLNRLRTLPAFAPSRTPSEEMTLPDDPRVNIVTLTNRPGRFDRRMHDWAMLAVLAAAAAVFLYTRRIGSGIAGLRAEVAKAQAERTEVLQSVENLIPAVSKQPDPIGLINTARNLCAGRGPAEDRKQGD